MQVLKCLAARIARLAIPVTVAAAACTVMPAQAQGVQWSIGVHSGGYRTPPGVGVQVGNGWVRPARPWVAPRPVYVLPPPVYVAPAPVFVAPPAFHRPPPRYGRGWKAPHRHAPRWHGGPVRHRH